MTGTAAALWPGALLNVLLSCVQGLRGFNKCASWSFLLLHVGLGAGRGFFS